MRERSLSHGRRSKRMSMCVTTTAGKLRIQTCFGSHVLCEPLFMLWWLTNCQLVVHSSVWWCCYHVVTWVFLNFDDSQLVPGLGKCICADNPTAKLRVNTAINRCALIKVIGFSNLPPFYASLWWLLKGLLLFAKHSWAANRDWL